MIVKKRLPRNNPWMRRKISSQCWTLPPGHCVNGRDWVLDSSEPAGAVCRFQPLVSEPSEDSVRSRLPKSAPVFGQAVNGPLCRTLAESGLLANRRPGRPALA